MELGFLTNSLRSQGLSEIASWAASQGFTFPEIGPHVPLEVETIASETRGHNMKINAFIYCRNLMSSDPDERQTHRTNLKARIEAAAELEAPFVTTSTGVDDRLSIDDNFESFVEYFSGLIEYARGLGVTLCIENCPDMFNLAHSPKRWERLYSVLGNDSFKLCLDPSHLIRLLIDPYQAAEAFASCVGYVHAKDTQVHRHILARQGILEPRGWWEYRLPGAGELNWNQFFSLLQRNGFTGPISIEHEDPIWSGDTERVKRGLIKGKQFLEALLR